MPETRDYPTDAELSVWPNCATPDCEYKQCLWSGTDRCFQCAERVIGRAELVRRYDATHDELWSAETDD